MTKKGEEGERSVCVRACVVVVGEEDGGLECNTACACVYNVCFSIHSVPVRVCVCAHVYELRHKEKKFLSPSLSLSPPRSVSCSLSVSPSPLFIRTRRPGRKWTSHVFGATQALFVLGAEVPKAVNLERPRVSGLSNWLLVSHGTSCISPPLPN